MLQGDIFLMTFYTAETRALSQEANRRAPDGIRMLAHQSQFFCLITPNSPRTLSLYCEACFALLTLPFSRRMSQSSNLQRRQQSLSVNLVQICWTVINRIQKSQTMYFFVYSKPLSVQNFGNCNNIKCEFGCQ